MATPGPDREREVGQCRARADGSLFSDGVDGSELLLPRGVDALHWTSLDVQTSCEGKAPVVCHILGGVEEADGKV